MADLAADLERLMAMHDRLLNGYSFHHDFDRATADLQALGRTLALLTRTDGPGWHDRPPVPGKYVVHRIDAPAVLWYVERPDEHDGPREGCLYYGPIPPDPQRTT